jgi:hypothetical protein
MSLKLIAALLILIISSVALSGCKTETTKDSVTKASLRRVNEIINSCKSEKSPVSHEECLSAYTSKNGLPADALIVDAYGEKIILKNSGHCAKASYCLPYSKGSNRSDDCGLGDDIVVNVCQ